MAYLGDEREQSKLSLEFFRNRCSFLPLSNIQIGFKSYVLGYGYDVLLIVVQERSRSFEGERSNTRMALGARSENARASEGPGTSGSWPGLPANILSTF